MNEFTHKKEFGLGLKRYLGNNGYTKVSFSEFVDITRPTLDKILEGSITSETTFSKHAAKICEATEHSFSFFIEYGTEPDSTPAVQDAASREYSYSDRAPKGYRRTARAEAGFAFLEDILQLASIYVVPERGERV